MGIVSSAFSEGYNRFLLNTLNTGDVITFVRESSTDYAIYLGKDFQVIPIHDKEHFYDAIMNTAPCTISEAAKGCMGAKDTTGYFDRLGEFVKRKIQLKNYFFVDYYQHNLSVLKKLQPGDLIFFDRLFYDHWAVYVGDSMVIHVDGSLLEYLMFRTATVNFQNFWGVAGKNKASIGNEMDKEWEALPATQIVRRAKANIGIVHYSLSCQNCEHFAKWCRYDISRSGQGELFVPKKVCELVALNRKYKQPKLYSMDEHCNYSLSNYQPQ